MKLGILFDLDGTLLDTLADLHTSVNYTMAQFGLPPKSREQVRQMVGNGARDLIEKCIAGSGVETEALLQVYKTHYHAHCLDTTAPYPGVMQMLETLSAQYPVAVVSNKQDEQTKTLCARFFPGVYGLGQRDDVPKKPAPHMVYTAMEALGITHCVYVGDSETDVQTAKNAGVPCLSVLWGFRDRQQLEKAGGKYFCENTNDLPKILDRIAGEDHGK